ncbi:SH3 domain-containing protein [Massilia forsythiae]|uniref:SH3 domain-containing protein n=1 Tax=Massilia forsythiae TaxID=2728020 RepID=UPI001E58E773|nr:SH3 domain-containing protein [Massilia forsythiae]
MDTTAIAAYGAALALTLLLAAWLTPRRWWRRPSLGVIALAGGGTLAFGALFCMLLGVPPGPAQRAIAARPGPAAPRMYSGAMGVAAPARGSRYLVIDGLNLRTQGGVRGTRVAVLPAGALVTAGGARDGDWWQVRARVKGGELEGWANSLWLRRIDERGGGHGQAGARMGQGSVGQGSVGHDSADLGNTAHGAR